MAETKQAKLVRGMTLFVDALNEYRPDSLGAAVRLEALLQAFEKTYQGDTLFVLEELKARIEHRLYTGHWE